MNDVDIRPLFTPGGDDALVYFVVFGADVSRLDISADRHRVDEIPDGIDAHHLGADLVRSFFEPPMGDHLREQDPDLAAAAVGCDSCLVITGSVTDPPTLAYLRDCIGIATAALDAGGVAVLSLQSFGLFAPERWRRDVFDGGPDLVHQLAVILYSEEEDDAPAPAGSIWVHTRGMRVFGRPDLSIHGVPADELDIAAKVTNVLIANQAKGLRIHDGAVMEVGPPLGLIAFRLRGHHDDPDFNNLHLELAWDTGQDGGRAFSAD
jgi:hypothetical protein